MCSVLKYFYSFFETTTSFLILKYLRSSESYKTYMVLTFNRLSCSYAEFPIIWDGEIAWGKPFIRYFNWKIKIFKFDVNKLYVKVFDFEGFLFAWYTMHHIMEWKNTTWLLFYYRCYNFPLVSTLSILRNHFCQSSQEICG